MSHNLLLFLQKNNLKVLLLFFIQNICWSQSIELNGQLIGENVALENIHIINLSNQKTAISNADGKFSIWANEDDLLVFSAIHIDYWRQSITAENIQNKKIQVKLTAKVEKLNEVIVEKKVEVTAQEMGIINYKPKTYTPAERKLKAATDLNGWFGLGFGLSLDPIINWASGRTTLLKNELKIEQKELAIQRINAYFDENYFTNTLKIPKEYHEGFKFFAVEHQNLYDALKEKKKKEAEFFLAAIAQDFLTFIPKNP